MCKAEEGSVRYAPLCISSFRLSAPRMAMGDVEKVNRHNTHLELDTVPERLRWCRQKRGLMQSELAEYLGISRAVYASYENGSAGYYPAEVMDRLAALFQVDVFDLLDDYNSFIYKGQGRAIREYRERMGLKRKALARMLGVDRHLLDNWENEKKRMSKNSWEKYFRGILDE